jgi:hypothetical protein
MLKIQTFESDPQSTMGQYAYHVLVAHLQLPH